MEWSAMAVVASLVFIVLDVITGFMNALMHSEVDSSKMREGLFHKATFIILIVLFMFIEYVQEYFQFMTELPTGLMVCVYVCVTELVSIMENLAAMNPTISEWKIFKNIKKKG